MNAEEPILFCPSCQTIALLLCGSPDADVVIDRCADCHGLWFDGGEIRQFLKSESFKERFLKQPQPAVTTPSSDAARDCPRCQRGLDQLVLADVTVDVCVQCLGVWLDSGELLALVQAGANEQLEGDDSLLAHEIREGLGETSLSPGLLRQILTALKDLLSERDKGAGKPVEPA